MDIEIKINCDNAAFENFPEQEIARILENLANKLGQGTYPERIMDINGNCVGAFKVIE